MSTTEKPKEYVGDEERPQGYYNGHDLHLAGMDTIWSIGKDPAEAILALCLARFKSAKTTEMSLFLEVAQSMVPLDNEDTPYEWGYRFVCEGTGFKAAGINVPGGAVCTWWK